MAISACGEGCHKQMEVMLNDIVGAVLPFLQDQVKNNKSYFKAPVRYQLEFSVN